MTSTRQITRKAMGIHKLLTYISDACARYIYLLLLKPKSLREDDKRRERILTIILFSISVFLLLLESSIISEWIRLGNEYSGINILLFTSIVISCLYLYYLTRIGYYRISAYIFICIYFALTVYGSIHYGASMPAGLLSYVLVITMASIVIGTRFGSLLALASISSIIVIGLIEHTRSIIYDWRLLPIKINDVIQYSVFFLLIAVVSWLSNSEMEKSLKRARLSEQLLKDERDNLEILVEARTKALREAEYERVAQLSRFAEFGKRSAGLFHDLLGPLSALTLTVGGLKQSHPDEQVSTAINTAIDATHRMQRFMDTIRKQLTEEETITTFSPFQQIEDAIRLLHYQAVHVNVSVEIFGNSPITLTGNPFKFTQIITNLISNAIESYSDSSLGDKTIQIAIDSQNTDCVITITDHGCGIPAEILPNIFNTFYTTKPNGIGLGLATVKDILQKTYNGTITYTSSHDGTTCIVSIPYYEYSTNNP